MSFNPYEFDRSYRVEGDYPFGLYMSNVFLWMFLVPPLLLPKLLLLMPLLPKL